MQIHKNDCDRRMRWIVNFFDLQKASFSLKSAKFECDKEKIKLELSEEIDFCWNMNLHLKFLTLYTDMLETYDYIRGRLLKE